VESNGARAVPISYYASNDTLEELFGSINGLLFPGGGAGVPPGATKMYELAKEANDNGDFFPIWGTCLGFEWLVQLAGGELDTGFDSENVSLPLELTDAANTSRLLSSLSPDLLAMLQGPNTSAFNNHMAGITPEDFETYPDLTATFTVLSTSADREGREFVSTMESPDYPFYGVQFHPEKNIWELGETPGGYPYEDIPHSQDAIDATIAFARFFISESRKSGHQFSDPATEQASLIWRYPVYYTAPEFVQEYIYEFE